MRTISETSGNSDYLIRSYMYLVHNSIEFWKLAVLYALKVMHEFHVHVSCFNVRVQD